MSDLDQQADFASGQPEFNGNPTSGQEEEEISLIDILLIVVRNQRIIVTFAFIAGIIGVLVAIFSAREYTSSARLIRELETEAASPSFGGNLSFLRGMGVNLGATSAGLTPDAYPDIVKSREVRLAVVKDTFYFPDLGRRATFVEYANQDPGFMEILVDYTIGLPWTIKDKLSSNNDSSVPTAANGLYPTEEEEDALIEIATMLGTGLDVESGLMTISVTSPYPSLSAELTQSFVDHLVERVREIRTLKARRNLEFIEQQFEEAAMALQQSENELASFEDRNNNIQRARLLTERARLQRQVTFKSDLYSSLQAQLTQAEVNLQRSEPVITLLERPVPPIEPSGSSRMVMVIWFTILGSVIGVGIAFVKAFIQRRSEQEEERLKIEELQKRLPLKRILLRLGRPEKTG